MTGVALRFTVLAYQRPSGRIVIEPDVGPPGRFVAVAAAFAHVFLVRIVFGVTRKAA